MRSAKFQRHNRFAQLAGLGGEGLNGAQIAKSFNMKAQTADARILQQGLAEIRHPGLRLIAGSDHISQRQATGLHGQIERDVGALGDDGHTRLHRFAAMLIRPEKNAVQVIDKAVTIGSEDWHFISRFAQGVLQIRASLILRCGFFEPRGKADRTPCPARSQSAHDLDRGIAVDAYERRVRGAGKSCNIWIGFAPADLGLGRVNGPNWPLEPDLGALRQHRCAPSTTADNGNGARPQQQVEPVRHGPRQAPKGRSKSRLMIWRWISEVPSQMRSTRASLQKRSIGKSSISPMPPKICSVVSVTRASTSEA